MTQAPAIPCTVKTFKPMQGFGTLVLEGGEELSFDISRPGESPPRSSCSHRAGLVRPLLLGFRETGLTVP